jgi:hypothetical protein
MIHPNTFVAPNVRFLVLLSGLSYLGLFGLLLMYLIRQADAQAILYAREFTPVFVIGFSLLFQSFTAGEYFGLMRYNPDECDEKFEFITRFATAAVSIFLISMVSFYYLRAGFDEQPVEKYFLIVLPTIPAGMLMYVTYHLRRENFMPEWYGSFKQILLMISIFGMWMAYVKLFFPQALTFLG